MARLGVHTFAFAPTWEPARLGRGLEMLRDHGVRLVEIPLLRPSEIKIADTLAVAREYDVELVCSVWLPGSVDINRDQDEVLQFLKPAFKVARELGSELLCGVIYTAIGRTTGRAPTQVELDNLARFLDKAAGIAAGYGLKLGIEPCNRYETHMLNTASQAVACRERLSADNVVIHLDTYHMHIEETDFVSAFAEAEPYLGYLHVSESHRGTPGSGMVNWQKVMEGLAAIDYQHALTLESMNYVDKDIAGALAIWRPVAEDPDAVVNEGLPFLKDCANKAGLRLD